MPKFLHTHLRIRDFDRSIKFYEKLGFVAGEKKISPEGRHVVFLTLPGNDHELGLLWTKGYDVHVPKSLMHTAVGVEDIIQTLSFLEEEGIAIAPANWREKISSGGSKMAFITDPDGYEVEIIERP